YLFAQCNRQRLRLSVVVRTTAVDVITEGLFLSKGGVIVRLLTIKIHKLLEAEFQDLGAWGFELRILSGASAVDKSEYEKRQDYVAGRFVHAVLSRRSVSVSSAF